MLFLSVVYLPMNTNTSCEWCAPAVKPQWGTRYTKKKKHSEKRRSHRRPKIKLWSKWTERIKANIIHAKALSFTHIFAMHCRSHECMQYGNEKKMGMSVNGSTGRWVYFMFQLWRCDITNVFFETSFLRQQRQKLSKWRTKCKNTLATLADWQ